MSHKMNPSVIQKAIRLMAFGMLSAMPSMYAQTYSLEDCLSLAMQNNTQIVIDELAAVSAKYRIAEVRGNLLPRVDLNSQYQYYLNLPEQYAPAAAFGGPEGEYALLSLNMQQTLGTTMQLSQPVINKEIRSRLHTAELAREASLIQTDLTKENVKYNVTATYYSIQVLQDNLFRLSENIENLEHTASINAVLKDNDIIAANVHHRLLINIEYLRNEYENQRLSLDKNLSLLKYLMNADMHDTITIEPFAYEEVIAVPIMADIMQRPDLRLQRAQIDLAEQDLKTVMARYAPVVTATFSTGFTGYNDAFAPYQQINGDWINGTYVSLNAKIPLFAGFQKKHQVSQQQITIQRSFNALSLMELQAEKEVMDAAKQYQTSKTQLTNTKNSLDQAEVLFASAQSDYANGLSSMTELLNAQNDLSSARTNFTSSLLNLKLAELSLKKAQGIL